MSAANAGRSPENRPEPIRVNLAGRASFKYGPSPEGSSSFWSPAIFELCSPKGRGSHRARSSRATGGGAKRRRGGEAAGPSSRARHFHLWNPNMWVTRSNRTRRDLPVSGPMSPGEASTWCCRRFDQAPRPVLPCRSGAGRS